MSKINHALPFFSRQHAIEPCRRVARRWIIGVVEVNAVCPSAADSDICRTQGRRQLAQASIGEVDGRSILKQVRIQSGRSGTGLLCRRLRLLGRRVVSVRFPEPSPDNLHHLDVVGLKPLIDRADARHPRRINRHNLPAQLWWYVRKKKESDDRSDITSRNEVLVHF